MIRTCALLCAGLLAASPAWALFSPKGDSPDEKRETIRDTRREILKDLFAEKPELKQKLTQAAGYASFSNVNINLLMVSTANGYGVVVDNRTGKETFMRMASIGAGIGAGVKDFRALFLFSDANTMEEFMSTGWQFGGSADAALKSKEKGGALGETATVAADGSGGVSSGVGEVTGAEGSIEIYQITETGIALQATIAGTKYWNYKSLNR